MKLKLVEMGMVFTAGIVGMGCFTAIVTEWVKFRRPKSAEAGPTLSRLDELNERLARLENATDSIAVEVERISEGQRFTTKLLAERGSGTPLPERARVPGSTTPH